MKEPASKAGSLPKAGSWVRIPPSPPSSLPSWFLRRTKRKNVPIPGEIRAVPHKTGLQRIGFPSRQAQSGQVFSRTWSRGPVSRVMVRAFLHHGACRKRRRHCGAAAVIDNVAGRLPRRNGNRALRTSTAPKATKSTPRKRTSFPDLAQCSAQGGARHWNLGIAVPYT